MSASLLTKWIGGSAGVKPGRHSKISWPFGKLTMYQDHLVIRLFFMTLELDYSRIQVIRKGFFLNALVKHTDSSAPDYISLFGIGLLDDIRRTNRRDRLDLKVLS